MVGRRRQSDTPVVVLIDRVQEHERRRAAASAEAEALAEAGDDASAGGEVSYASAGGEVSYAELSNDGGSQEDEPAIFSTEGSRISRKKRKKIFKTSSIGSRGEGSAPQGSPLVVQGGRWGSCACMQGWEVSQCWYVLWVGLVDLLSRRMC